MLSDLFDVIVVVCLIAVTILGVRAYRTGDLAAWAFDNFPAIAMAIYPENAPGAAEARERMAKNAAHAVADKAVDAVADVADAVIPGAGEAVENVADWVLPDLSTASLPALPSAASVIPATEADAPEVEVETPELKAIPPNIPDNRTEAEKAEALQIKRVTKPAQVVYQRYDASAFTGLCAHVKAAGLDHVVIDLRYPDAVSIRYTVYVDRVTSQPYVGTCGGVGFCLSGPGGLSGFWHWSDPKALAGMANLLSASGPTHLFQEVGPTQATEFGNLQGGAGTTLNQTSEAGAQTTAFGNLDGGAGSGLR